MKYLLLCILCFGCAPKQYQAVKHGRFFDNINEGCATVKILHVELSQGHRPARVVVQDEGGNRFVVLIQERGYGEFGLYPQVGEHWWMNKRLELIKQPEA